MAPLSQRSILPDGPLKTLAALENVNTDTQDSFFVVFIALWFQVFRQAGES
jgi:hypothetical protein